MQTGTKISGVAHMVLVGTAIFGGAFTSEPLPFEVQDVSIISADQFAAMTASTVPPAVAAETVALPVPDLANETPEVTAQTDAAPDQAPPETAAQPVPDEEPETLPDQPEPEPEPVDTAPTLEPPQPEVVIQSPEVSPTPELRPVDRVAPVPVVAPPPDTTPDEVETPQIDPDEGADLPQEPSEATAPQEANDRIVTEADKVSNLAPTRSARPPARPSRRAATPNRPVKQVDTSEPAPTTQTGVNDALAEALGTSSPAASVPSGPPLSGGERDSLRAAVSKCWNVGSLSSAALRTTVVVGVSMSRQGKPETGTIRLLSSSGGPEAAARQAYEAARRAIIRCGARGYDLPVEKYGQWREIEMTFNPERMRIK